MSFKRTEVEDDLRVIEQMEDELCRRHRIHRRDLYAILRHADFHERGYRGGPDKLESWHVASYAIFSGVLLAHDLSGQELRDLLLDFERERARHQDSWDAVIAREVVEGSGERQCRDYLAISHRYMCQVTREYSPPQSNPRIMEEIRQHDLAAPLG